MSFRKNNREEKAEKRKWEAFCQTNWELIERTDIPLTTIETLDRFYDLLMHGYLDHHDDPLKFSLHRLQRSDPERFELFKELVDRYFEAGFSNPGMTPAAVGGREGYLNLVRKYPGRFSDYDVASANEPEESKEG